jgi:hypothetical protein
MDMLWVNMAGDLRSPTNSRERSSEVYASGQHCCLLGIDSQFCHIAKYLNFFLGLSTSSSPLNQIRPAILTCVFRTAYDRDQHAFSEIRVAGSYLLALLTRLQKPLDTNGTTKGMPRSQIVLCAIPHAHFACQCILISVRLFQALIDAALPRRHPLCSRKFVYGVAGGREWPYSNVGKERENMSKGRPFRSRCCPVTYRNLLFWLEWQCEAAVRFQLIC